MFWFLISRTSAPRFYTYIGTLSLAMSAAKQANIHFIVLDRPQSDQRNDCFRRHSHEPGPLERKSKCGAITSIHPIPTRHGMTIGELARLFNSEFGIGCKLTVIPMQGWQRSMYFSDTRPDLDQSLSQHEEPDRRHPLSRTWHYGNHKYFCSARHGPPLRNVRSTVG